MARNAKAAAKQAKPDGKFSVYQLITDQIISSLEAGTVPWKPGWVMAGHGNLKSKKAYRGINQFLCALSAADQGFESPWWLSFKQIKDSGGTIKKGEHGTIIVFWKRIQIKEKQPDGSVEEKTVGMLRYYRVWNIEQTENVSIKVPKVGVSEFTPIEAAEKLVAEWEDCPEISHGGNDAAYAPKLDKIFMPTKEQFKSPEHYYKTLFHEMTHSTGHETRLKRDGIVKAINFGSDPYAREELVAEMGSAFLCGIVGIYSDDLEKHSAAYIKGWLKKLKDDPKLVIKAANEAQVAADYVQGVVWDKEEKEETPIAA